jgi:hypothetical protein
MIRDYKTHEGKRFSTLCKRKMLWRNSSFKFYRKGSKVAVLIGAGSFAIKTRFKQS